MHAQTHKCVVTVIEIGMQIYGKTIIYLQEGGVGWVQLGVALNLEDKNNSTNKTTRRS